MNLKPTLAASALAVALAMNASAALARDIVMGLIPAENNEEMVQKFEPMRAQLETMTRKCGKCRLIQTRRIGSVMPSKSQSMAATP